MSDKPIVSPEMRELAASIYVNLVGGAIAVSSTGVKMSAEPKNLARVSFKLAEAFVEAQAELNAPAKARSEHKLEDADFASWMK